MTARGHRLIRHRSARSRHHPLNRQLSPPTTTGQVELQGGSTAGAVRHDGACAALTGAGVPPAVRSTVVGERLSTRRPHLGRHSQPPRAVLDEVMPARSALGEEQSPRIRLHDLRHTHATLRPAARLPRPELIGAQKGGSSLVPPTGAAQGSGELPRPAPARPSPAPVPPPLPSPERAAFETVAVA